MSPGYEFQTRARQRMEMSEMFAQLGITSDSAQSHLYTQFQGLSDRQFDILWNYTEFATHVSARYEAIKVANARDAAMIEESFADDIQEALDWAKSL